MSYLRQLTNIRHEQLRISDDLKEQCDRLIVNQRLHLLRFRKVSKPWFHAEATQRVTNQRDAITKKMFRRHNVQSCPAHSRQGIGDGRHTRIQCRHARSPRDLSDTLLQIGCRGIGNAGI